MHATNDNFSDVSKEEFDAFVAGYPNKLVRNVSGISEPPTVTYNDFSLGDWPDSVIAIYKLGDDPSGPPPFNEPDRGWRIRKPEK